jgi:hypothetical protein
MAYCPADNLPCIDDLCYGNGCLKLGGEPMLTPCLGCGVLVPVVGRMDNECDCESDWRDDESEDSDED